MFRIIRVQTAGIYQQWMKEAIDAKPVVKIVENSEAIPINMEQMSGKLYFKRLGLSISAVIFAAEITVWMYINMRRRCKVLIIRCWNYLCMKRRRTSVRIRTFVAEL